MSKGPAACGPAVPTASAFGIVLTSARPTSRGQALCVSFRLGRWCEQTAVCDGAPRNRGVLAALPFLRKSAVPGIVPVAGFPSSLQGRGFRPFYRLRRASVGNRPRHGCGYSRLPPMRKGRLGGNDASLPRGARICCWCAGSTLFAPAGQKRFRDGAPDFGRVAGESGALERFAHQERLAGAPGERKHAVLRSMRPPRPRNHPAGRTAGSARTRSRVQTLENPLFGDGGRFHAASPSPKTPQAAGPLLVGLPPSARSIAPSGTNRSTPAPCSWGGCASTSSQRLLATGTAG